MEGEVTPWKPEDDGVLLDGLDMPSSCTGGAWLEPGRHFPGRARWSVCSVTNRRNLLYKPVRLLTQLIFLTITFVADTVPDTY